LQQYLERKKLSWREDASNVDQTFSRNRIRHHLLPAMEAIRPGATEAWAGVADLVRRRSRHQHRAAKTLWQTAWKGHELDLEPICAAERPVRNGVWRHLLVLLQTPMDGQHFQHLDELAKGPIGRRFHLGNWMFLRRRHRLVWHPASVEHSLAAITISGPGLWRCENAQVDIQLCERPANLHCAADQVIFNAEQLHPPFVLRRPRHGESWQPFGCSGHRPLRQSMAEHGIPSQARASHFVLADDQGIIWIPGVGIAERGRIDANTKQVWQARWTVLDDGESSL
jgi:tRNA(Ile)-lysidine synthase